MCIFHLSVLQYHITLLYDSYNTVLQTISTVLKHHSTLILPQKLQYRCMFYKGTVPSQAGVPAQLYLMWPLLIQNVKSWLLYASNKAISRLTEAYFLVNVCD